MYKNLYIDVNKQSQIKRPSWLSHRHIEVLMKKKVKDKLKAEQSLCQTK